jgi:hypothetical protein
VILYLRRLFVFSVLIIAIHILRIYLRVALLQLVNKSSFVKPSESEISS